MKSFLQNFSVRGLLLILALLITSSCEKEKPLGSIEGFIFFAGTNIPVSGVNVDVGGVLTKSNENGHFRLEEISQGDHTLLAEKDGFLPFSIEISISGYSDDPVAIPMISPGLTSRVYGRITGALTGNPMSDISVVMFNPDGFESDLRGSTDENGYYEVLMVPHGERKLLYMGSRGFRYEQTILLGGPEYQLDIEIEEPSFFSDPRDGKEYVFKRFGTQLWMLENLAWLPEVSPPGSDSYSEKLYYVYGYDGSDKEAAKQIPNYGRYGVLYNWPAAESACPDGWHLPTDDDWQIFESYLGMDPTETGIPKWRMSGGVGAKLKNNTGWEEDGNGNNSSGFSIPPAGYRGDNGSFGGIGKRANIWTASTINDSVAFYRYLAYDFEGVYRYAFDKNLGFSVRCMK